MKNQVSIATCQKKDQVKVKDTHIHQPKPSIYGVFTYMNGWFLW